MRTTLALDDDVLAAAKGLASLQRRSLGEVISDLARQALRSDQAPAESRNGVPLLPGRAGADRVTLDIVNRLRDEQP
jgi:hypothetical protein